MHTDNAKSTTHTHARVGHKAQCTKGTAYYHEAESFPYMMLMLPVAKVHMQVHRSDKTKRERGEGKTERRAPHVFFFSPTVQAEGQAGAHSLPGTHPESRPTHISSLAR